MPGRLGGKAHHEDGTEREIRRDEAGDALLPRLLVERGEIVGGEPGRPDDAGDARSRQRSTFARTASGRVKSIATSWPAGSASSPAPAAVTECPAETSAVASTEPTFPAAPKRSTFMRGLYLRPVCDLEGDSW